MSIIFAVIAVLAGVLVGCWTIHEFVDAIEKIDAIYKYLGLDKQEPE